MPELPEVHTTVTELGELLVGHVITNIWSGYDSKHFYGKEQVKDPAYFTSFRKKLIGSTIIGTSRIGKNVLIHTDRNTTIVVHMKMTGHLLYGVYVYNKKENTWNARDIGPLRDDKWNGFIRMVFSFDNGAHVALSDLRKFAKVTVVETDKLTSHPDFATLGPDPTTETFSYTHFKERLMTQAHKQIKQVLLDQTVLAGIGNIYSDEALWIAGIHPTTLVTNITPKALQKLFDAVQTVLRKGIDFRGDSTSDYRTPSGVAGAFHHHHQVYRRTGLPCTKRGCGGTIKRLAFGGRGAHFCDVCQL